MSPPKGWPSVSFRTRLMAHFMLPTYSVCQALAILEAGRPSGPLWETGDEMISHLSEKP